MIQKLLGHKDVRNTMKHVHTTQFKDDEFEVTTPSTLEEDKEVLSAGFNYTTERQGIKLYRRPTRFGSIRFTPPTLWKNV